MDFDYVFIFDNVFDQTVYDNTTKDTLSTALDAERQSHVETCVNQMITLSTQLPNVTTFATFCYKEGPFVYKVCLNIV